MIGHINPMDRSSRFDTLYRNTYRHLFLFAYEITGDREACRDIISETFVNLWNKKGNDIEDVTLAYLKVAVRNGCVSWLRHKVVERKYEADYIHAIHEYSMDDVTVKKKDKLVRLMLSHVPSPPTREILIECYLNRKTYHEVAKEMGISPDTVKKHISKSLKILRALFEGKNIDDVMPDFDV